MGAQRGGGDFSGKIHRLPNTDSLSSLAPFNPQTGDVLGAIVNDQYGDITNSGYVYLDYTSDANVLKGTMILIVSRNTLTSSGAIFEYDDMWHYDGVYAVNEVVTYGLFAMRNKTGSNSPVGTFPFLDAVNWENADNVSFDDDSNPTSLIGADAALHKIIECDITWNISGNYIGYLKDPNGNEFFMNKPLLDLINTNPWKFFPLDDNTTEAARDNVFDLCIMLNTWKFAPIGNTFGLSSILVAVTLSCYKSNIENFDVLNSGVDIEIYRSNLEAINHSASVVSSRTIIRDSVMNASAITQRTARLDIDDSEIRSSTLDNLPGTNGAVLQGYTLCTLIGAGILNGDFLFSNGVIRNTSVICSFLSTGLIFNNVQWDGTNFVSAGAAIFSNSVFKDARIDIDDLSVGANKWRIIDSEVLLRDWQESELILEDPNHFGDPILSSNITPQTNPGDRAIRGMSNIKAFIHIDPANTTLWNVGTNYFFGVFADDATDVYVYINPSPSVGNLQNDIVYWHRITTWATNTVDLGHNRAFGHIGWFKIYGKAAPYTIDNLNFANDAMDKVRIQPESGGLMTIRDATVGGGNVRLNTASGGTLVFATTDYIEFDPFGIKELTHYIKQ